MLRRIKAKTRRTKVALENKAPKIHENPKQRLFMHGNKSTATLRSLFVDLSLLTKPDSKLLSRKKDSHPFDDDTLLEKYADKFDASLIAFATSNKKRPDSMLLTRMFNFHVLDMYEFGITNYKPIQSFPSTKPLLGAKPCLVFQGGFEQTPQNTKIKSMLVDFFRGPVMTQVNLAGLDHVIVFTLVGDTILFRHYRTQLKKSDSRLPLVELIEVGPAFDMHIQRVKLPSNDQYRDALRVPSDLREKKVKNISVNDMGEKLGRIHMTSQDLNSLQVRRTKALRNKRKSDEPEPDASDNAPDEKPKKASKPKRRKEDDFDDL